MLCMYKTATGKKSKGKENVSGSGKTVKQLHLSSTSIEQCPSAKLDAKELLLGINTTPLIIC